MAINRDDAVIRDFARHRAELRSALRAQAYLQIWIMANTVIAVGFITGHSG